MYECTCHGLPINDCPTVIAAEEARLAAAAEVQAKPKPDRMTREDLLAYAHAIICNISPPPRGQPDPDWQAAFEKWETAWLERATGIKEYDEVPPADLLYWLAQQAHEDSRRWFNQTSQSIAYMTLAMCGEVGEVANLIKKIERGSVAYKDVKDEVRDELADVFTYLIAIAGQLGIDLLEAYAEKRKFNEERFGKR